jgi:hypothetical protein
VAEGCDYALLSGAEWLSETCGADNRCATVSLATDEASGAEYLACASIFPPPAFAKQAVARGQSSRPSSLPGWGSWEEALAGVKNEALVAFAEREIASWRTGYLPRRMLNYYTGGRRRWSLVCWSPFAYVWQRRRFSGDVDFWTARLTRRRLARRLTGGSGR